MTGQKKLLGVMMYYELVLPVLPLKYLLIDNPRFICDDTSFNFWQHIRKKTLGEAGGYFTAEVFNPNAVFADCMSIGCGCIVSERFAEILSRYAASDIQLIPFSLDRSGDPYMYFLNVISMVDCFDYENSTYYRNETRIFLADNRILLLDKIEESRCHIFWVKDAPMFPILHQLIRNEVIHHQLVGASLRPFSPIPALPGRIGSSLFSQEENSIV